jgi:dihydropteroate synthase
MFTLNCIGRLLLIDEPIVMGIINTTPDSFFADSQKMSVDGALRKAEQMLNEGAIILDIGGQSTKPGSEQVGADEETRRVLPVIEAISKAFPSAYLSVDTFYAAVAKAAVEAGACIVNDVSGGEMDAEMLSTVAALKVPYVCMHMQGKPSDMQTNPTYANVVLDVLDYFIAQKNACKNAGIKDVIFDVGFGFGKTIAHNFQLLKNLATFKMLDAPMLVGLSRKSMIYKSLQTTAEQALNGTTVLNSLALQNGANILRVHDVQAAVETIKLYQLYAQS